MTLDPSRTINGSFCKVYQNGNWILNAKGLELQTEINYEDIIRAGTRKVGKKATTIESTGTMTNYKVTHAWVRSISSIKNDAKGSFKTELLVEINDPENPNGKAWIRVKGVQFSTIPILNYEVGQIVEEELPFVFDDWDFVTKK
ncbi:phage tail tube protein [Priestia megaterium]|uniref:phage tail tube protein n=1 Tax=Priestia megaterium TaxID=1404 RepID=UPI001DF0D0B1|nr:phage tail tube protein [Priestia megaterium]CAH0305098.1 Phage-like element PBSX protein XkdM [Priestia megaterium]